METNKDGREERPVHHLHREQFLRVSNSRNYILGLIRQCTTIDKTGMTIRIGIEYIHHAIPMLFRRKGDAHKWKTRRFQQANIARILSHPSKQNNYSSARRL